MCEYSLPFVFYCLFVFRDLLYFFTVLEVLLLSGYHCAHSNLFTSVFTLPVSHSTLEY